MNQKVNLKDNETSAIQEFKNKAIELFPGRISLVELFGSKARGEENMESDIDILIVIDREDINTNWTISKIETELLLKYGVLISTTIIAKESYDKFNYWQTGLIKNIQRDGIELWKTVN